MRDGFSVVCAGSGVGMGWGGARKREITCHCLTASPVPRATGGTTEGQSADVCSVAGSQCVHTRAAIHRSYAYAYVYVRACVYVRTCVCVCVCIRTYVCIHMFAIALI